MNADTPSQEHLTTDTLAPVAELQEYGASIISELDRAEAELNDSENQPFSGISPQVMQDISELRKKQFDMFRQHVEIEQQYKIQNAVSEGNNVHQPGFTSIAKTLRKKEKATAGLLHKLEQFDGQLRDVMDKFETCRAAQREQDSSVQTDHLHHNQPQQPHRSTPATNAHLNDDN
ncbi:hypothetical protein BWQ96_03462 [Gracilariopsis chorda]|uniref:Uncharacterized protein n=1 Tax=Gracilariopsis chorda TaxID=448386 RepID=A0A2V3IXD3_9FLOR|nr:hypothetical protein BWQ96_03462 [Gracilariopsis chorda]|eukprot:PXF46771.1 hypothetical protein BWQ96_03462 [Gracilariopsis chorda]